MLSSSSSSLPSPTPSSFSYSLIQCYCIRRLSTAWRQMCLMAPNVLSCFWNEIKFPFFQITNEKWLYVHVNLSAYVLVCGFSNAVFFFGWLRTLHSYRIWFVYAIWLGHVICERVFLLCATERKCVSFLSDAPNFMVCPKG